MKVSIELYCMSEDGIFAFDVYPVKEGKVTDEELACFEVSKEGKLYENYEEETGKVFIPAKMKVNETREFDIAEDYANKRFQD